MYDFSNRNREYEKYLGSKSRKYYLKTKCTELLRLFENYNSHSFKVLDLGCGDGLTEKIIHKYFNHIIGIDSSKNMLAKAQKYSLPNCHFIQADALHLPFSDNHFDLIFQFSLFHHLPSSSWKPLLKEIIRVASKPALLLTFEHNPSNFITRRLVRRSPIDIGTTLFNTQQMVELYEAANITIIKKGDIIFFPPFLSSLSPLERLLHSIPYGGQYYILGTIT